jgi:hypothetical protein
VPLPARKGNRTGVNVIKFQLGPKSLGIPRFPKDFPFVMLAFVCLPLFAGATTNQVVEWGDTREAMPGGLTNVMAVAAGSLESLALNNDGTVVRWGYYGGSVPLGLSNVVAIASGGQYDLALTGNGTVVAWGIGTTTNVPTGLSNIVAISAGNAHCLALNQNGTVVAWGDNSYGQTNVPAGLSNIVAVAAGFRQSLALIANGTMIAWGSGPETNVPAGLSNVVAIAAGGYKGGGHSLALEQDGTVAVWGTDEWGQTNIPAGLNSVVAIAAGYAHSLALKSDGTVVGWGYDNYGQADTGGLSNVVAIAAGGLHSVALELDGLSDYSLGYALNATNLAWESFMSTNKSASWFSQSFVTHDGVAAAQSGPLANNQSSYLLTTLSGPGTLTFWWKVSSLAGHDFLNFYLDSSAVPLASISGQTAWQQQTITVPSGSHIARWVYSKDGSGSYGQDAGWVDQVTYPTAPAIVTQPSPQTASLGSSVTITATANGAPPFSYQWLKNGTNLPGATSQLLTLTGVTRLDSAVYALSVTNTFGVALSSNATLTVRIPLYLSAPALQPDGSFSLLSEYADGSPLQPSDLAAFEVQAGTNLTDWITLTNALTLTNGWLRLVDTNAATFPCRFYRILEN